MTTREDIDQAMKEAFEGVNVFSVADLIVMEAARRGRLLFPSVCQTCGGSGLSVPWRSTLCSSCGGLGKVQSEIDDLLQMAWVIIANASQGIWEREPTEWVEAAVRWRNRYHAYLAALAEEEQ